MEKWKCSPLSRDIYGESGSAALVLCSWKVCVREEIVRLGGIYTEAAFFQFTSLESRSANGTHPSRGIVFVVES